MTGTSAEATYTLTLASAPGWSAPATVRLRKALKLLLRSFGLRVVSIVENPAVGAVPLESARPDKTASTGDRETPSVGPVIRPRTACEEALRADL